MLPEEQARVLVFLAAVATVYVSAAGFGLRLAIQRAWGRQPFPGERRARGAVFAAAAAGILCVAYGRFIEPYWLQVEHVQVDSAHWRGTPLRIVHLSDVHSDSVVRLEDRIPGKCARNAAILSSSSGD
jgi:hypothetical protein